MVHANCTGLLDLLGQYQISITEITDEIKAYAPGTEEVICEKCNKSLEAGNLFFEGADGFEEFEEKVLKAVGSELSKSIEYCSYCDGGQLEYIVDRFNQEFEEDGKEMDDEGIDAYDFLSDAGIPEEYQERMLEKLYCRNCGYGSEAYHPKHNPDGGYFDFNDRFYTQKDIDSFYGVDYEELHRFATLYGITLDEHEFEEFKEYIYKYPMLAYKHDFGQKIYRIIRAHYEDEEKACKLEGGSVVYRGRIRENDKQPFKADEMWSPPDGLSTHGRYNSVGIPVLYCADEVAGIPFELHPIEGQKIDIATIKAKRDLRLLDVTTLFTDFAGFFNERDVDSKLLKKSYILTNFIRDCCQDIGYSGVIYEAVSRHQHKNYALFNYVKDSDLVIEEVISHKIEVSYQTAPDILAESLF